MKILSSGLLLVGLGLIAFSGWQMYQSTRDVQTLVEIQWPIPELATVGEDTRAPITLTNNSSSPARIVGLNHC
ncbi:MAG: hypothetical protein JNL67_15830 [Planctomycetaceae bacterium]|nr:hypothetical protein [Planctomycetaceae bacterium]